MWLTAEEVVRQGIAAVERGDAVHIPGRVNRFIKTVVQLMPDRLALWLSARESRRYRNTGDLTDASWHRGPARFALVWIPAPATAASCMSLFPTQMRPLPYRKPTRAATYWVVDDVLPNADDVRAALPGQDRLGNGYPDHRRSLARHARHARPARRRAGGAGREGVPADRREEGLGRADRGRHPPQPQLRAGGRLDSRVRSSRIPIRSNLCRYAAVLYLNPDVPEQCGTSFFRQRMPGGQLGGNIVMPPHRNLVEALGQPLRAAQCLRRGRARGASLQPAAALQGQPDPQRQRLLGPGELATKRMTAVFFWMA